MMASGSVRRAFSLVELVIVIVIIGIIGAIAIPRMSRGAAGAADSSLVANLSVLRNALSLYEQEHGGAFPAVATFEAQMTKYSDDSGATNATKTGSFIYGPYLRAIPALPLGPQKGATTVAATAAAGVAWIYDDAAGTISANTGSLKDAKGVSYSSY